MTTLCRALSMVWHCLDLVLRPVLFVLVGLPARVHPLLGLLAVSLPAGALMVLVFRAVSNQRRIAEVREQMKGHLLGALVFSHSLRLVLRCLGKAVALNGRYLAHAAVPLLVMALPVSALFVQLQRWYSWRPPRAGEPCLVLVRYRESRGPDALRLQGEEESWRVGRPFVFPSARVVAWRVTPTRRAGSELVLEVGGRRVAKSAVAGTGRLVPLSPVRSDGTDPLTAFLHPGEPLLPADAGVASITLRYPSRRPAGEPWYTHWAVWFLALTMASGLLWSRVFRVSL